MSADPRYYEDEDSLGADEPEQKKPQLFWAVTPEGRYRRISKRVAELRKKNHFVEAPEKKFKAVVDVQYRKSAKYDDLLLDGDETMVTKDKNGKYLSFKGKELDGEDGTKWVQTVGKNGEPKHYLPMHSNDEGKEVFIEEYISKPKADPWDMWDYLYLTSGVLAVLVVVLCVLESQSISTSVVPVGVACMLRGERIPMPKITTAGMGPAAKPAPEEDDDEEEEDDGIKGWDDDEKIDDERDEDL